MSALRELGVGAVAPLYLWIWGAGLIVLGTGSLVVHPDFAVGAEVTEEHLFGVIETNGWLVGRASRASGIGPAFGRGDRAPSVIQLGPADARRGRAPRVPPGAPVGGVRASGGVVSPL